MARILSAMTRSRLDTIPLPVALHLAMHTAIGLFCMFAGVMNLIDFWVKIWPNAVAFLSLCAFSWGYVFGIFMARREALLVGFAASAGYALAGLWLAPRDWLLGLTLLAIGVYGLGALFVYRGRLVEA
jgi:hypothetical protein